MSKRIQHAKEIFDRAHLSAKIQDNVLGLIWDKLSVSIGINAIAAVCNIKNGLILEIPQAAALQIETIQQSYAE